MFNTVAGSFQQADLTSTGLAIALTGYENYYEGWYIVITMGTITTYHKIESNDASHVYFANTLTPANGSYAIQFVARTLLTSYDSVCGQTTKVSDALLSDKITLTANHIEKLIRKNFRNQYENLAQGENLEDYITGLFEVQDAFCYYCLFLVFTDAQILKDDMSAYKADKYYKLFQAMITEGISMLVFDENQDGDVDNEELAANSGKGMLLER